MPPIQTEYKETLDVGRAGHIVNTELKNLISKVADGEVGLGRAVVFGSADRTVREIAAGDTELLGISVRERSLDANHENVFASGDNVRVMTQGVVFVTVSTAVSHGQGVQMDPVNGNFMGQTIISGEQFVVAGAKFDSDAAAGEVARVRLT